MQFSTVAIVAGLTALVSAQTPNLPGCALTCLLQNIGSTGCSTTDFACACSNQPFINASAACIRSDCSPADVQASIDGAVALCKQAGVDIVIPAGRASRVRRNF